MTIHHPDWMDRHPVGSDWTPTVRWGPYAGRPWVAHHKTTEHDIKCTCTAMWQIYKTQPTNDTTCSHSVGYSQNALTSVHLTCISLELRGHKHGLHFWQKHHHEAQDALRGATRKDNKTYNNIWNRWQNDATYRKSQQDMGWSDAWVRYIDHIAQIDISHTASHQQ